MKHKIYIEVPIQMAEKTGQATGKKETKQDDKDRKIKDLTDSLQRLQAEFENYKKRVDKEKCEFAGFANKDTIIRLLPVIDSFELALQNTANAQEFVKGVKLIFAQLYSVLESLGLKKINALGERFDPYKHEVLLQEKSQKEPDVVIEELQKGYLLGDKVIRHAKVKISKGD
jgi:molecular chaperone GrpE